MTHTSQAAAALSTAVLGGALLATVALTTPWRASSWAGDSSSPDPTRDLTAGEIARSARFGRAMELSGLLGRLVALAVVAALAFTHGGARLAEAVSGGPTAAWPWPARAATATVVIVLVGSVAVLPIELWRENVSRRYGISIQSWRLWTVDWLRSFALQAGAATVGLFLLQVLARMFPRSWWAIAAVVVALCLVGLSFVFPLIIEPLFNSFGPLQAGELRTRLIAMAAADGVSVSDVLVADASRRTTALNAYVSGFGATRRIVVYDTLLQRPDDEVALVVAHELGHAARGDVLHGTAVGALGASAAVCLLGVAMSSASLLRRAGVDSVADTRSVALVIGLVAVIAAVSGPGRALVSRRIEARADVHSLETTRDPAVFTRAMRQLALANLANPRPHPLLHTLFADHPAISERVAVARAWAARNGVPVPPDLAVRVP